MKSAARFGIISFAGLLTAGLATAASAQQPQYPKPTELPNPYRLVEDWPTLPQRMNGGRWGEVIRVHVHSDGNIWVFHRCFNTVPPGHATCLGWGASNPPILSSTARRISIVPPAAAATRDSGLFTLANG